MKLNFKQIYEGWKNHLIPAEEMKETIEQVSQERLAICKNCPFNSTKGEINNFSRCKACGCPLKAKTKCLSCTCGIKDYNEKHKANLEIKWLPVATPEQRAEIEVKLNLDEDGED